MQPEKHCLRTNVRKCIQVRVARTVPSDNILKNLLHADKFGIGSHPPSLPFLQCSRGTLQENSFNFFLHRQMFMKSRSFIKNYWQYLHTYYKSAIVEMAFSLKKVVSSQYIKKIFSLLSKKKIDELRKLKIDVCSRLNIDSSYDTDFWEKLKRVLQGLQGQTRLIFMHKDILKRYLERQITSHLDVQKLNDISITEKSDINSNKKLNTHKIRFLREQMVYKTTMLYVSKSTMASSIFTWHNKVIVGIHPTFELTQRYKESSEMRELIHNFKNTSNDTQKQTTLMDVQTYLQSQILRWHHLVQTRQPNFFNRIHTGYEWNKFNQTHYNSDNPPPKVVLGYKFNIFYPDLIDMEKTPSYYLERDYQSIDSRTCIIRFHARTQYSDIAFRIVNKQWEVSTKKGFACIFKNKILHLHFNFLRLRYRR
eukprot:gnl/MRDRNA2_/MRDRNA2_85005_c0_seq1.p1 gnl/MRDRNA2_/MRDRNA2_85005_c0~~gnl/MRDRNA2_/MRDRNA2_85005_c0_seq1.p1  ORF type:complete len:423 (+),score=-19.89 gnl/MRDRNA2_/MRDRNA2_85005_c0_seq1:116-1384(+)